MGGLATMVAFLPLGGLAFAFGFWGGGLLGVVGPIGCPQGFGMLWAPFAHALMQPRRMEHPRAPLQCRALSLARFLSHFKAPWSQKNNSAFEVEAP